jgi:hypothetical protein
MRALKEGHEIVLPKAVADRLANGENAVLCLSYGVDAPGVLLQAENHLNPA